MALGSLCVPLETKMTCSIAQDIIDHIIDHLHDSPETLRECCLVAKSWVYQARWHLFNRVRFTPTRHIAQWRETFPDTENSPARHVRNLTIDHAYLVTPADVNILLAFRRVSHLKVNPHPRRRSPDRVSLVPLYGLSPVVKSLCLVLGNLKNSETFGIICSFPLLEDLSVVGIANLNQDDDLWDPPFTSPRFTGSLELHLEQGIHSITSQLLSLPNGLHFRTISVRWFFQADIEPTMDLVSRCSDTLQSLTLIDSVTCTFHLASAQRSLISSCPRPDASHATPLDLSQTTKLTDIQFQCNRPNVLWVAETLRTANIDNLQKVSLYVSSFVIALGDRYGEWPNLDHLFVLLWYSHSLRPTLTYKPGRDYKDLADGIAMLLPESTRRVAIKVVKQE